LHLSQRGVRHHHGVEAERLERGSHRLGVVHRVLERHRLVGAVADDEREAMFPRRDASDLEIATGLAAD
jgi:hypothetical protein